MCEIDVRDPGRYTLHVGISWFYGSQEPGTQPIPRSVGALTRNLYLETDFIRSLVHDARAIGVSLSNATVTSAAAPRFGAAKCATGDHLGRWLSLRDHSEQCVQPYCTGNTTATIHKGDMVSALWSRLDVS